jgi:hypothetical protein
MCVALVSDAGTSMSTSSTRDGVRSWGVTRIGQAALLVELIERLRQLHHEKDIAVVSVLATFRLMWFNYHYDSDISACKIC